jgi:hypothetical protein
MDFWNLRKYIFLGILLLVTFFIAFFLIFKVFYKKPTCFDGIKNQNEIGVDCGGVCSKICEATIIPLEIRWSRAFQIKDRRYSVLSYVENNNLVEGLAEYSFGIYDEQNILIRSFEGRSFVPAHRPFTFFMGNIDVGERTPGRVIFKLKNVSWNKNIYSNDEISIKEISKEKDSNGAPRISAYLLNNGDLGLNNVVSVAVLYNALGDAIGALKIPVGFIKSGESKKVFFSWPGSLVDSIDRVEILKWIEPEIRE